jgi:hypothetical protein
VIHLCIGGFSESDQNDLKLDPFILNRKTQGSRKPLTVIAHYREDLDNACLPSHTDFVPLVVSKLFFLCGPMFVWQPFEPIQVLMGSKHVVFNVCRYLTV